MATNEEIMEESRYYPVLKESDDEMAKVCVRDMLNEARSDTAKQIFKVIDRYEVTKYKPESHGIAWLPFDEYQALKKKYEVD